APRDDVRPEMLDGHRSVEQEMGRAIDGAEAAGTEECIDSILVDDRTARKKAGHVARASRNLRSRRSDGARESPREDFTGQLLAGGGHHGLEGRTVSRQAIDVAHSRIPLIKTPRKSSLPSPSAPGVQR